jgi:uncharacterized protein YndB with AHSA1/START domain
MKPPTVTHHTFVIERIYESSVNKVFRAWADPVRKARWFAGSADALGHAYQLDFSVGGREVLRSGPAGGPLYTYTAEFRDIINEQRIVAATDMLADETRISVTLVTLEFQGSGDATRLVLTEQGAYLDGKETPTEREHGTRALLDSLGASLADGER